MAFPKARAHHRFVRATQDIESIDDIPMFSGDHWAASIAKKKGEQRRKEDVCSTGSKYCDGAVSLTPSSITRDVHAIGWTEKESYLRGS